MKIKTIRQYRRGLTRTSGLLVSNPVVALGMALPFVIVPVTSLKTALIISAFIAIATIPVATLAPLINQKVPAVYRLPIYSMFSLFCVIILRMNLTVYSSALDVLGLYVFLSALNGIMIELTVFNCRETVFKGFKDSLFMCLGFLAIACIIGSLREVLTFETIGGMPIKLWNFRLVGVSLPFFGFILIGLINALFRNFSRVFMKVIIFYSDKKKLKAKENL